MKNTILALAAGCASAAILSGHVFSQSLSNQPDLARTQNTHASASAPATSFSSSTPLNAAVTSKFSLKAIKDFKNRFPGATSDGWYSLDHGFAACFTEDGFKGRAIYNSKGHWLYSIRNLDEKKLPRETRDVVKRTYYDFTITLVQLVQVPDHTVYLVHMEDSTSAKIIRVSPDGEMDVYKEFTKG